MLPAYAGMIPVSGKKADRPQLRALLDYARPGDTIIVWRLDRLGRTVSDLIQLVNGFHENNIGFISLTNAIDTTTPGGRFVFYVFAGLAEFERDLDLERTMAGLEAARARGIIGGRQSSLNEDQKRALADMHARGETVTVIARTLGTSRATVYRQLDKTT